jgi:hypothetical protein
VGFGGSLGDELEAKCFEGLGLIRQGRVREGRTSCESAIAQAREKKQPLVAEHSQLLLAEALFDTGLAADAAALAKSPVEFFGARGVAESTWRARRVMGDRGGMERWLGEMRAKVGAEIFARYEARPDLRGYLR